MSPRPSRESAAALQQIEKQNNLRSGQLIEILQQRGIDRSSLIDQITASIVWAKLVRRQASQTVEISDDEIEEATKRAQRARQESRRAGSPRSSSPSTIPAQDEEVRPLGRTPDRSR